MRGSAAGVQEQVVAQNEDGIRLDRQRQRWGFYVRQRRKTYEGQEMWPRLTSVAVPRYKGSGHSALVRDHWDRPESLPDLFKMPGPVLYGWRDTKVKNEPWVPTLKMPGKGTPSAHSDRMQRSFLIAGETRSS